MKIKNNSKIKDGFSIIEVILSASILAVIVFGIVSAWLYGEHALVKSGDTGRGVAIASEGIEIARNLRDFDFGILNDGNYALKNEGSGWTLVRDEKEIIGSYERYITIESDGISKRKITSIVEWTNVDRTPGRISSSTILTNWTQTKNDPKKTTALTITNVNASPGLGFVTITWTTNKPSSSQVQYGGTASWGSEFPIGTPADTSPMVLNHSVTVTGLELDATYHYRVISTDATNATAYSIDDTFTTDADETAPVISSIVATPSQTSVTITWDTDEVASSFVDYGTTSSPPPYGATTPEIDTVTRVIPHEVTITGLSPSTLYHFRVNSNDASGNLGQSSDQTFTTLANLPVISNVVIQTVSATYITISWDTNVKTNAQIVDMNGAMPQEGGGYIYERESPIVDTSPMTMSHTVTISGLTPCTTYDSLRLLSNDELGSEAVENVQSVMTIGCPPEVVAETASEMSDITDIAVMPAVEGDEYSFVYAINSESPEMNILKIGSNFENQTFLNSEALELLNIASPVDIESIDRYLYVANAIEDAALSVFSIDPENNGQITFVDLFHPREIPTAIYIKQMPIESQDEYVLFMASTGVVKVYDMHYRDDVTNLYKSNNWEQIGEISLPTAEMTISDIYVPQPVDGVQSFYAVSPSYFCYNSTDEGLIISEFTCSSYNYSDFTPKISGNVVHEVVMLIGNESLRKVNVNDSSASDLSFSSVKYVSKTPHEDGYMFFNTDLINNEFLMFKVEATTINTEIQLDLANNFSIEHYGSNVGGTVAYLNLNGYVLFTKLNKLFLIDPNI